MKVSLKKPAVLLSIFLFLIPAEISFSRKGDKISPRLRNLIRDRGEESSFIVWVYFMDKGSQVPSRLEAVRMSLAPRALRRRMRHRSLDRLVDEYDVPVWEQYVEKIKPLVSRVRHKSRWLNAVSVEAKGMDLLHIAEWPHVKKIEQVRCYRFPEPVPGPGRPKQIVQPYGKHVLDYGPSYSQVQQLNVPALHDEGFSGKGVLLCMMDTGFNNLSHEALGHLDILASWDFVNNDPDVSDEAGDMGSGSHGTRTLGVIAGYSPGQLIGPAYGASFLLAKTENTEWERHIEEDHWIAGAEWADDYGAGMISSSLGYLNEFTHGEANYTWEDMDGVTAAVTRGANIAASRGILVVNSAGNEGPASPPENTLVAPSDSSQVIAAGGVDEQGRRVYFSSMGPTADGRIKPDVMARGLAVYTSDTTGVDDYCDVDGTSFACPLVAGVAALIMEVNPEWTNMDVRYALKWTAGNSGSPDNSMGWGIVNAENAAFTALKSLFPPADFSLQRVENHFGFFIQYVDRLSWKPNAVSHSPVVYYRLYGKRLDTADGEFILIAQLDSQTFSYERRGLLEDEAFLYKITSVNSRGEESEPEYARW